MASLPMRGGLLLRQLSGARNTLSSPCQLITCLSSSYSSHPANDLQKDRLLTIPEVRTLLLGVVGKKNDEGKIESPACGVMQRIATSQEELPERQPSDSYTRAIVPLGSDELTRQKYLTLNNALRFGRILEDFDSLAGLLCYKHNLDPDLPANQKSPLAFVTALVDRIEIEPSLPPLSPFKDIIFDGKITWTGKSSMECSMSLEQEIDGKMMKFIKAKYVFVARNPVAATAAIVNPLVPVTDEDKELFRQGQESKVLRIEEANKSVLKTPASTEESLIIHNIFLSTIDAASGTLRTRVKPENTIWMGEAIIKSLIICQPEQRNCYNKIFGGFLMRKAFELAWTSAAMHSKSLFPRCRTVDDILFRKPVEIGSLLFLSSQIVYSKGSDLQTRVHAEVVNPQTGSHETTNDFHFTFDCGTPNMKQVIPKSYAESMLYVDAKRRYDESSMRI